MRAWRVGLSTVAMERILLLEEDSLEVTMIVDLVGPSGCKSLD